MESKKGGGGAAARTTAQRQQKQATRSKTVPQAAKAAPHTATKHKTRVIKKRRVPKNLAVQDTPASSIDFVKVNSSAPVKRKIVKTIRTRKRVQRLKGGNSALTRYRLNQENNEHFSKTFTAACRVVGQHIECARKRHTTSGVCATAQESLTLCSDIAQEIQDLRSYLHVSVPFLSDSHVQQYQDMLNQLGQSCKTARLHIGLPSEMHAMQLNNPLTLQKQTKQTKLSQQRNPNCGATIEQLKKVMPHLSRSSKTNTFNWTISNRSGEHIVLQGSRVHRRHLTIANLHDCFVELRGHPVTVQISHVTHCVFLVGPTSRALLAWHCDNSVIAVACQQLRLHASNMTRVYTCGRATIEECHQIEFGEYCYTYPGIDDDFQSADINFQQLQHAPKVTDINCMSPYMRSPNWRLVEGHAKTPNWTLLRNRYD